MKLFRYGEAGAERPGLVDGKGKLRDLSGIVRDIDAWALSPEGLKTIAAVDPQSLPEIQGEVRYGVPVAHVPNLVCIGLNYTDHAEETNAPIPTQPIIFNKHTGALCGANDPVWFPADSTELDWEVELAFVIGSPCWNVSESDALSYIAGYTVLNDISERDFQLKREGQWAKGKSHPGFAPCGPWIVTADEVGDPQALELSLDLNGTPVQRGYTSRMIFTCAFLVSYISHYIALQPGDIVTTGTPPGVGLGKIPPQFMKPGDEMRLSITRLGEQRQVVTALTEEVMQAWRQSAAAKRV